MQIDYKKKYFEAQEEIVKLSNRIASIEKQWALEYFEFTQKKLEEWKPQLDPATVPVKATNNRKSLIYLINPKEVICVKTNAKKKFIYLINKKENIEGELCLTDIITVNRNDFTLKDMCNELDI